MEWYYAEGKEKRGPLTEAQMLPLVTAGIITAETLVWATGMPNWKPARETPLISIASPAAAAAPGHQLCIITGKSYPVSQMIQTQHGWVSAEGKDRYYQSLREGVPIATAEGVSNARRDGKRIVVPAAGAKLPLRCVKTNEPLSAAPAKEKTLYWCSPWVTVTILLNILIMLILYLALRKKVKLAIPLGAAGRSLVRKHLAIAWAGVLAGIVLFITGLVNAETYGWLILLGLLAFLFGAIYGNIKGTVLRVTKLKDGYAWLSGACPDYVASLPPY